MVKKYIKKEKITENRENPEDIARSVNKFLKKKYKQINTIGKPKIAESFIKNVDKKIVKMADSKEMAKYDEKLNKESKSFFANIRKNH